MIRFSSAMAAAGGTLMLICTAAADVKAQATGPEDRGFYLEVGIGQTALDEMIPVPLRVDLDLGSDVNVPPIPPEPNPDAVFISVTALFPETKLRFDDQESTRRISFGYRFSERFGAEFGYQDLGDFRSDENLMALGGSVSRRLSADQWLLGVSYDHSISPNLSLFGKLALSRLEFDVTPKVTVREFAFLDGPPVRIRETAGKIDDETGGVICVGVRQRLRQRLSVAVSLSRYDLGLATSHGAELTVRWAL